MNAVRLFQIGSAALLLPAHSLGQPFVLSSPLLTESQGATATCALNFEESAISQGKEDLQCIVFKPTHYNSGKSSGIEYILIANAVNIVDTTNQLKETKDFRKENTALVGLLYRLQGEFLKNSGAI